MFERVLSTLGIFLLLSSNYVVLVLGFGEEGPPCIDVANKRIRIGDNMGVSNPWSLAVAAKYVEQLTGWDITWQRAYGGERSGKERSDELTMLVCEQNSCVLRFFSSRLLRSPLFTWLAAGGHAIRMLDEGQLCMSLVGSSPIATAQLRGSKMEVRMGKN